MKFGFMFFLVLSQSLYAQVNPDLPNQTLLTNAYLEEISKREVGQSKFAIKAMRHPRSYGGASSRGASSDSSREIQESDIFKLGKKGKKELFLLNRYRGFQVVSFADGLENPRLVGRFPVYNNWSSEMYYLEKDDKVLVVNTEWSYSQNMWQTNYNTILYLIDVANSSEPKIVKELTVPGYLEESRMVGDVLYTITNNGSWSDRKAQITSVKLSDKALATVDKAELHGEDRWVRTMNVIKEGKKFFVISTLTDWRGKGDFVNIHDISSEEGKIAKHLTAKSRGQITERSQTFIHKNHLFAISNFQKDEHSKMRVSVEAFPMEKTTSIIESKENMRVSIGDTNGQHASLQDVRLSGDMLYTFWVPANNIDPFDLFDISEPSKGIKHLGQLQFDGWISKAFPLEFDNRKFVLGLGWIVPAASEDSKRYPQAKLFEIKKVNETHKHEVVASLTLDSDEVWASMNNEDKFFEVLQETPGNYNIMFPVTFSKNWKSGAKVVNLDLNKLKLSAGASIVGEQSWLNRVFVNREVQAINSFSDESLATFRQDDVADSGVAKTVSVLELARNIIDFHVLNEQKGFQIIGREKSVEIRQVDLKNADAEKMDTEAYLVVKGTHSWHKVKNDKLYLITSSTSEKFEYATFSVVDLKTGAVTSEQMNIKQDDESRYFYFNLSAVDSADMTIIKIGKQIFKFEGESLKELDVNESCQYFFDESSNFSFHSMNKEIFAYTEFQIAAENGPRNYDSFSMPFMKKIGFEEGLITCSNSVNVPGKPLMLQNNFLVAADSINYHRGIYYSYGSMGGMHAPSGKTFALKFNNAAEVEITDILNKSLSSGLFKDMFITSSANESRLDIWSVSQDGQFVSRPHYMQDFSSTNSSLITVKNLAGRDIIFMKNDKKVSLYELNDLKRLKKLEITSSFDLNEDDGLAEFVFDIQSIEASKDQARFFISQGMYGVSEIILK